MIAVLGPYHGGTSATMAALAKGGCRTFSGGGGMVNPSAAKGGPGYECHENRGLQRTLKQCWKEGPMTPLKHFVDRVAALRRWADQSRINPAYNVAIKHPLLSLMIPELREVFGDSVELLRVTRPEDSVVAALERAGGFWGPDYFQSMTRQLNAAIDAEADQLNFTVAFDHPDHAELVRHYGMGKRDPDFFKAVRGDRMPAVEKCPNHNRLFGLADFIDHEVPNTGRVVELGVFHGVSTELLAIMRPRLEIVGVDRRIRDEARARLARYKNVQLIESGLHKRAARTLDRSLDGVYLDTVHNYEHVAAALKAWTPKVKPGGFIAGHDYWPKFPGLMRAVCEFRNQPPRRVFADSTFIL